MKLKTILKILLFILFVVIQQVVYRYTPYYPDACVFAAFLSGGIYGMCLFIVDEICKPVQP